MLIRRAQELVLQPDRASLRRSCAQRRVLFFNKQVDERRDR
jgi:hypothetical protein